MAASWLKNVATLVAQLLNPTPEPGQHIIHEVSWCAMRTEQLARRGTYECLLVKYAKRFGADIAKMRRRGHKSRGFLQCSQTAIDLGRIRAVAVVVICDA